MAKRFTDTEKYKKQFLRGLQGPYKLLWDYLYHDCNHAGIWYVDFGIAQIYLGEDMPVNKDDALRFFNNGEKRVEVLDGGKKWFIPSFVEFQYGTLNPENRAHASVISLLQQEGVNKGLIRALQGRKDKEGFYRTIRSGKFKPPILEEVKAYCQERKNNVSPQKFIDHYEAKGWMIGKNKMKSWKAAVRTWEKEKPKSWKD